MRAEVIAAVTPGSVEDAEAGGGALHVVMLAEDVEELASGGAASNDIAERVYREVCVSRNGLLLDAPDTLYGWCGPPSEGTEACTELFDAETMAEIIFDDHGVAASATDVMHASASVACVGSVAQDFFENQLRTRGTRIVAVANPRKGQNPAAELARDLPRYRWAQHRTTTAEPGDDDDGPATPPEREVPWSETMVGPAFAERLQGMFQEGTLAPAVCYEPTTLPFPEEYDPRCADGALVERLARGEWHDVLDAEWDGLRIVRVPMYRWEIRPDPPGGAIKLCEAGIHADGILPDPLLALTAAEMAEDLACLLNVAAAQEDVEALATEDRARSADVNTALDRFRAKLRISGGVARVLLIAAE